MIKAIIIDDEISAISAIDLCLKEYCKDVEVVATSQSSKDSIELIKKNKPDVIFLDIEMPHMNGFELLEHFPERNFLVIFITAYDEFAIKAFKVNAIDYLLKPINIQELIEAVNKVKEDKNYISNQNTKLNKLINESSPLSDKIAVPGSEGIEFFKPEEIIRITAEGSYSFFILTSGAKKIFSKNLKAIGHLLKSDVFFRVHRSHIINLNYVKRYQPTMNKGEVEMIDGTIIPVARAFKKELAALINK